MGRGERKIGETGGAIKSDRLSNMALPDREPQEYAKGEFIFLLRNLQSLSTKLYKMSVESFNFLKVFDGGREERAAYVQEWKSGPRGILGEFKQWQKTIEDIFDLLQHGGFSNYIGHDLTSVASVLIGFLEMAIEKLEGDNIDMFIEDIEFFLKRWPRCFVALEDITLRAIDKDSIGQNFCDNGVDVGMISEAVSFLTTEERTEMERKPKYSLLSTLEVDISEFDPVQIKKLLRGRIIHGPTGFIGNFIMNELRNIFQNRTQARNVKLSALVEDDEFVIKIQDDGKGMKPENLQYHHPVNEAIRLGNQGLEEKKKLHTAYIFEEGASGVPTEADNDKSSGLGIANFDKRLASIGGKLRIVSREEGAGENSYFNSMGDGDNLTFGGEHGTIFEVRLPLKPKI